MTVRKYTLSKDERLSWKRYIDLLFSKGESFVAFPLRVVYLTVESTPLPPASILVSVPKKRFRRAVKRNLLKRLVRESYRQHKYEIVEPMEVEGKQMLIAFLYIHKEICSYETMEKGMLKALTVLKSKV